MIHRNPVRHRSNAIVMLNAYLVDITRCGRAVARDHGPLLLPLSY